MNSIDDAKIKAVSSCWEACFTLSVHRLAQQITFLPFDVLFSNRFRVCLVIFHFPVIPFLGMTLLHDVDRDITNIEEEYKDYVLPFIYRNKDICTRCVLFLLLPAIKISSAMVCLALLLHYFVLLKMHFYGVCEYLNKSVYA